MKLSSLRQTAVALLTVVGFARFLRKDFDYNPTTTSSVQSTTSVQQQIKNHINKIQFLAPISCNNIPTDTAPHYTIAEFPLYNKTAVVDYAPWTAEKDTKQIFTESNGGLYHQILAIDPGEIFVDVGANIGQMTMVGLVSGVTTFAFDPLEYDIMKICSGVNETVKRGHTQTTENLHLFRALVGNESQTNVSITRPDDAFGKFEQASLFANTIGVARKPKSYVKEYVPMITLDEIIPPHLPIGLVKIDVQGFEWPVVQGMKGLLERKAGYPRIVHYEEQRRVTLGAGFKLGAVQAFLEGYNYTCKNLGNDISCKK
ncbi:hypothetical protein ACHAWT_000134 [Skeletonema menzelii]